MNVCEYVRNVNKKSKTFLIFFRQNKLDTVVFISVITLRKIINLHRNLLYNKFRLLQTLLSVDKTINTNIKHKSHAYCNIISRIIIHINF